MASWKSA
jgi:Protein of unknown function (DUF3768)